MIGFVALLTPLSLPPRRLRASRRQIAHATRAARTRRLELEEMVASFALSGARPIQALSTCI